MKIKICGLTRPEEADYVNRNRVDFAGMVLFFQKSKRNISIDQAKTILAALNPSVKSVAVVVSPTPDQAMQIEQAGFDYIQIHGELSPEILEKGSLPILRALNSPSMTEFESCEKSPRIAGYVIDAAEPGSGKPFDWNTAKSFPRNGKLFLLAGGLTPDNVADAIRAVQPDGVDVSSGAELTKELPDKDAVKIDLFVKRVRETC